MEVITSDKHPGSGIQKTLDYELCLKACQTLFEKSAFKVQIGSFPIQTINKQKQKHMLNTYQ